MNMKFEIGNEVNHPHYGVGIVMQAFSSASGVNELYEVFFVTVLRDHGIVRCLGSDLSLVEHEEVQA